jgi:hypothetical protein
MELIFDLPEEREAPQAYCPIRGGGASLRAEGSGPIPKNMQFTQFCSGQWLKGKGVGARRGGSAKSSGRKCRFLVRVFKYQFIDSHAVRVYSMSCPKSGKVCQSL